MLHRHYRQTHGISRNDHGGWF